MVSLLSYHNVIVKIILKRNSHKLFFDDFTKVQSLKLLYFCSKKYKKYYTLLQSLDLVSECEQSDVKVYIYLIFV